MTGQLHYKGKGKSKFRKDLAILLIFIPYPWRVLFLSFKKYCINIHSVSLILFKFASTPTGHFSHVYCKCLRSFIKKKQKQDNHKLESFLSLSSKVYLHTWILVELNNPVLNLVTWWKVLDICKYCAMSCILSNFLHLDLFGTGVCVGETFVVFIWTFSEIKLSIFGGGGGPPKGTVLEFTRY